MCRQCVCVCVCGCVGHCVCVTSVYHVYSYCVCQMLLISFYSVITVSHHVAAAAAGRIIYTQGSRRLVEMYVNVVKFIASCLYSAVSLV